MEILEKNLKGIGAHKIFPCDFKSIKGEGGYILVLYLPRCMKIKKWIFYKGVYLYVGSAKNSFAKRLKRYLLPSPKKRWHIDFLRDYAEVICAFVSTSNREEDLARFLYSYYIPIPNFGNTDCRCVGTHLFYLPPFHYIVQHFYEKSKEAGAPVHIALERLREPYDRFIFSLISPRTKDEVSLKVTEKFVKRFPKWEYIKSSSLREIESLLFPVAYYKKKAYFLKSIAERLSNKQIPSSYEELISLPGVGNKVAKIVLADIFGKDVIGVDTHVHRISNRLGWVNTPSENHTEKALEKIIPKPIKRKVNISFVGYGQTICTPQRPKCDRCEVKEYCKHYCYSAYYKKKD